MNTVVRLTDDPETAQTIPPPPAASMISFLTFPGNTSKTKVHGHRPGPTLQVLVTLFFLVLPV